MNSSAALKGFCGEHGGIVCTSSNATEVLKWALAHGQRALFFPDQHLGRNTGKAIGIPLEQMPLWDPNRPPRRQRRTNAEALPRHPLAWLLFGAQALSPWTDRSRPSALP